MAEINHVRSAAPGSLNFVNNGLKRGNDRLIMAARAGLGEEVYHHSTAAQYAHIGGGKYR